MKKIFTMMVFAAATISFAAAQSKNEKSFAYNDSKKINTDRDKYDDFNKNSNAGYNDSYFSYKEKQAKLEKINREFDKKIITVKNNRRLSGREKAKQIQFLQMEQKKEISKVEYDYAKRNQKGKNKNYGYNSH